MSLFRDIVDAFGIRNMPWLARALLFVIVLLLIAIGYCVYVGPDGTLSLTDKAMNVLAEALKTSIAAFIGSFASGHDIKPTTSHQPPSTQVTFETS